MPKKTVKQGVARKATTKEKEKELKKKGFVATSIKKRIKKKK